jgi:tetratricopeptide (TPR) repeat protein
MLHCFLLALLLQVQFDIDSLNLHLQDNPADIYAINTLAEALAETDSRQADSLALIALELAIVAQNIPEQARAAATISNVAFNTLDYPRTIEYAGLASGLFKELDEPITAASFANDAALAAYEIDLYDDALRNYHKTLRILLDLNATEFMPSVLVNMAQVYMKIGKNDSSIYYNQQAIGLAGQPGMERELSAAYGMLGLTYKNMGNFAKALESYQKALAISESINDLFSKAVDINNIAGIYMHWENYEMAMDYYRRALDMFMNTGRHDQAEITMNNIAFILQKQGNLDAALTMYRESLAIALDLGRTGSVAVKMGNLGGLYFELGNYDSAIYYQKESLRLSKELGRKFSECASLQSLAGIYLAKGNLEEARRYIDEALPCARSIQAKTILEKSYQHKSDLYEKLGDSQQALEAYRKHVAYKDSIFTLKNKEKLDELEAIYQNEKRLLEIEMLTKDMEINEYRINRSRIIHYWMGSGLAILLIASAALTLVLVQKSRANKKLVEKNLELIEKQECDPVIGNIRNSQGINDEEKRRLIIELNRLIRQEKIFTQKQLALKELAEIMGTNTSYLSQVINTDFGRTFNDFMNQLRIQEAQKMFAEGKHKIMSIEGIADAVGFHSRSVFNLHFKKFSGVTPSVFIANLKTVHATKQAS